MTALRIKKLLSIFLRVLLFAVGGSLVVNAFVMVTVANRNLGILMTGLLGTVILSLNVFYNLIAKKFPLAVKCFIVAAFAFLAVGISSVYIYGGNDSVTYDEELVIVLGAGLHGDKISKTLKNRLDKALDYYEKNPNVKIAVTGGQGADELIPEGEAMAGYLVENGVPPAAVIKETESKSTVENFENLKKLLDREPNEYKAVYITDDFHILRAGITARKSGFENIGHIHSSAPIYTAVSNGLREVAALMYEFVFN